MQAVGSVIELAEKVSTGDIRVCGSLIPRPGALGTRVLYCMNVIIIILCSVFQNGFALIRPPGHHALPNQAM